jgi:ubiquitin C-terminal hydrolase
MDSTLICIFIIPNEVITNNILKKDMNMLKTINRRLWSKCGNNINIDIKNRQGIQKALNEITLSIRGLNNVNTCTNLRSLIKKCPGSQPFHERGTQDAGEFLAYLFNLFQVDVATTSRKTYASNDFDYESKWVLTSKNIDEYSSPIIDIVSTAILDIESGYNITNFLTQTEDSVLEENDIWTPNKNKPLETYIRRKEVFKIKKSPFVVFNLSRTYVTLDKRSKSLREYNTWKLISAPEDLLLNGKNLKLSAIVVHTGGAHYVANFKCNDQWFWYDDNPSSSKHIIKNIGSYNKMLKTSPNPLSHGTLFFYT